MTEFSKLGLLEELVVGLSAQGFSEPTPVQKAVVPRLLAGENIVMAASTGSGKTLAFCLPIIQSLVLQEQAGYTRMVKRPRCLILVPTRELAQQVLQSIKTISHHCKMSSCAVLGGEPYGLQKKNLDRLVDIVVASPGRLMQHKEQGNVYLSHVSHVIIDEVDTMLTQGFGSDIRAILRSVASRPVNATSTGVNANEEGESGIDTDAGEAKRTKGAQLVMATATLTKAVRTLLVDVEQGSTVAAAGGGGKDNSRGLFNIEFSDPTNLTPKKKMTSEELSRQVSMKVVEVDGVHRILPNVKHIFEDVQGVDKMDVLRNVLTRHKLKKFRTLIFCNTVQSCRAVEYALHDSDGEGTTALSYHGDLNSLQRSVNLDRFRKGEEQYMVCTDIAARGLDIPEVRRFYFVATLQVPTATVMYC
jgi:superfamily II DNA/RNA helicase